MKEVECPLSKCGYTGKPKSVEAHISSKTRDGHQGEVGREYRDELMEDADEKRDTSDSDTTHSGVSFPMQGEDETNTKTEMNSSNDPQAESGGGSEKAAKKEGKDEGNSEIGSMVVYAIAGLTLFAVLKSGSGISTPASMKNGLNAPKSNYRIPQK